MIKYKIRPYKDDIVPKDHQLMTQMLFSEIPISIGDILQFDAGDPDEILVVVEHILHDVKAQAHPILLVGVVTKYSGHQIKYDDYTWGYQD